MTCKTATSLLSIRRWGRCTCKMADTTDHSCNNRIFVKYSSQWQNGSRRRNRVATLMRCGWTRLDGSVTQLVHVMRVCKKTYSAARRIFIARERSSEARMKTAPVMRYICLWFWTKGLGKQTRVATRFGWSTSRDFPRSLHHDCPLNHTPSYAVVLILDPTVCSTLLVLCKQSDSVQTVQEIREKL